MDNTCVSLTNSVSIPLFFKYNFFYSLFVYSLLYFLCNLYRNMQFVVIFTQRCKIFKKKNYPLSIRYETSAFVIKIILDDNSRRIIFVLCIHIKIRILVKIIIHAHTIYAYRDIVHISCVRQGDWESSQK